MADGADATTYTGDARGPAAQPEAAAARAFTLQVGGAFAGYAAMIVVFVVAGTVGLSVRHRRRDLALLRAVAATPGQLRRMLLAEVGLLAVAAVAVGVPVGLFATGYIRDELVSRTSCPTDSPSGEDAVRGGRAGRRRRRRSPLRVDRLPACHPDPAHRGAR
ncbi:hypothetical protein SHKM778_51370 [Streptomyces sp. KM77-8]|uniref:ABC3 transporter permease C-terminal domain-containing protein n=1 Tax=Streptomyces haneummycinicus TaxID=3074435 RepID=A0AAT9HMI8_9ACTN